MKKIKNIISKYKEKIKLAIIEYYDKKYPEYCWANLVMWAYGNKPFFSLFCKFHPDFDYDQLNCPNDQQSVNAGGGYCGKCDRLGRMNRFLEKDEGICHNICYYKFVVNGSEKEINYD